MFCALLISFGIYLFLVYPRISVYPGATIDRYNPFRTPFLVENVGYMSVFDVSYSLIIARTKRADLDKFTDAPVSITNTIPRLYPNRKISYF